MFQNQHNEAFLIQINDALPFNSGTSGQIADQISSHSFRLAISSLADH